MKVLILSRAPHAYSTRRLREACLVGGYTVRVLDTLRFSISVEQGDPQLYYRDKRLSRYDAVIPRVGTSVTLYGTAVVRQFEQMGVFTLASSHAIRVSRDKLRSLQVLSRHQIGIPPTVFVQDPESVAPAIERLGGAPVVIKVLEGTQGGGVILAESVKMAQSIIDTLHRARQHVLIQRFVEESRGKDIRAAWSPRCGAWRRGRSSAATSTSAARPRPSRSRRSTSGARSTRRRSWACASRAWTCSSRTTGRS